MTKQEFEEQYVIPFSDYFGLNLPYGIFDGFQSEIVARVYPEYSFYGKLNLHVEGGISHLDGKIDALFVIFINNRFVQCSMCRGVLGNVVDESTKKWGDWKLYIDEFDEFLDPERLPKERQVSGPVDGESTIETIKRNFMIDELIEIE